MATNSVTAVELVTADGRLVRADAEHEPDLFWAVRGGGGNFGVVTAMEFRLYPIETAYAGMLVWDRKDAEKVLRAWARWTVDAPDEVTTAFRILQLPPFEEIPAPVRGRQLAMINGAVLGDDATAEALLAELRALEPEIDTFARVPSASPGAAAHGPGGPDPGVTATSVLGELTDEAIDAFLGEVGDGTSQSLLAAELRQLGGALARPHAGAGALPMLQASSCCSGWPSPPRRRWPRPATPTLRQWWPRCRRGPTVGSTSTSSSRPATPAPATTPRATRGCSR